MNNNTLNKGRGSLQNMKESKIFFLLSILTSAYWCIARIANIHQHAFVEAIYELFWLPMLAMLFILPVLSVVRLIKGKFSPGSLYLYAVIVLTPAVLIMFLR